MITQTYDINLIPSSLVTLVRCSQYDTDLRTLVFNLYDDETLFDATGYTVRLGGTKPDKTGFLYDMTVNGSQVSLVITEQMTAVAGPTVCEITVYDSNDGRVSTVNFILQVERSALAGTEISETEIPLLQEAIDASQTVISLSETFGSPLVAQTAAEMTLTNRVYVYTGSESGYTAGNWYYYNGSAWVSGGVYQSAAVVVDSALSTTSQNPVQNKVITEEITDLKAAISDLQENTEIGLFGAKWDRLTNRLTRLYGAKGITTDTSNFGHFGSINANYDNPFDNIYPWSDMFVCDVDLTLYRTGTNSLKDCVTAVYGDPDFTYEGDADTFVGRYRPKFWYKTEEDADGNVYYYVSQIEREGFAFSDEAIDGVGFCVDAGNNNETSGAGIPHTNIAVSTIHSRAKSSGFTLRDIFAVDAITTLYLVEYANWNSQQALGDGCSSCYRQNAEDVIANVATTNGVTTFTVPYVSALVNLLVTGSQLSFGASSGSTTYKAIVTEASNDGTNFTVSLDREIAITNGMIMSVHGFSSCEFNLLSESVGNASGYIGQNGRANAYYRGSIMYANRYQYTLGIYRQAQTNHLWIADEVDPDDYDALNTSVHTDTGVALPDVSASWLTVGGNAQRVTELQSFLATGTSSGSSASPVGDQQYVPAITAGDTILLFGCYAGYGWCCGLAGGSWNNASGTSYWADSAAPLLKNPL